MQTLVTLPLELLENLFKLRLSKIPEPFFTFRKHQISLMEAEMTAPGKELAYVIKAQDEFSDNDE